jgi:hypothetical protein
LLAAIPTAVACGNATDDRNADPADSGAAAPGSPQTLDDFEQHFAERYCQSIAACCTRQGFPRNHCSATLREHPR